LGFVAHNYSIYGLITCLKSTYGGEGGGGPSF
jgi:hypothetical protein